MIYKSISPFLFDIIANQDTTNEKYYACEEELKKQKTFLEKKDNDLCDEILKKANQLMWLNLTLNRAVLSQENKAHVTVKKEKLIQWFKEIYGDLNECKDDIDSG